MIDPIAPRYVAITRDSVVPMRLLGVKPHRGTAQKHPKDPSVGMKDVFYGPNILLEAEDADGLKEIRERGKVTLINWGNAVITRVSRCDTHTHTHNLFGAAAVLALDCPSFVPHLTGEATTPLAEWLAWRRS